MNLYITVEIASRELESKTFLSCCAAKEGFDVYVGTEDMIRRLAFLGKPGILMDKSIHSEYPPLFNRMKKLGYRIAVNDEEGLCLNPKQYGLFNLTPAVEQTVDTFFAWGSMQRDIFVKHLPCMADNVHITGNPRLDILHPSLRKFHDKGVQEIKKKYGQFILINTRFSTCNNPIGGEAVKERFLTGKHGPNIDYLMKRYEADEQLFDEFFDSLKKLCTQYPDKTFVLRPHPSEKMDPWLDLATQFPNLKVVREGNVHKWILASSMLIQNGCTTAIEAFLLDTPCICYRPIKTEFDDCLPNNISFHVFNYKDLCRCVEGGLDEQISAKRFEWEQILAPYAKFGTDELAATQMVQHLLKLAQIDRPKESIFALWTQIDARFRHWNRSLKWQIKKLKNQPPKVKTKWKELSVKEFTSLVHGFDFYDETFASIEITQAYKDCFRMRMPKKKCTKTNLTKEIQN